MGSAISSGTYAKPVKAMYSASIPIIGLHHGASRNGLPAPPRRSPRRSDDRTGGVCRPAPEPKDHDYLELADLQGEDSNHHSQVLWTRGLLIRRNIANGDLAYFT